jgi:hypothetical protein
MQRLTQSLKLFQQVRDVPTFAQEVHPSELRAADSCTAAKSKCIVRAAVSVAV